MNDHAYGQVAPDQAPLRERADNMVQYALELHGLLDGLEDRLFEPVPREVAKNAQAGQPITPNIGRSIDQARHLISSADDRLRSMINRL